jgi:hypothetical protein
MKATLDTKIISNFLLYVDHTLQKFGSAYSNYSGQLYPVPSDVLGRYAYAAPFKPWCNDTSISGAQVMSGVYVNGTYSPLGVSGLIEINHYKGVVYFNGPLTGQPVVSGNYAIKDFGVVLSDQPEWKLLLKSNNVTDNSVPQILTGLPVNTKSSPVVYVVVKGQENKPFGFNKINESMINLRCVIISDNEFQNVGACSILKNTAESHMPMMASLPFNQRGGTTGLIYNYETNPRDTTVYPWIAEARASDILQKGDFADMEGNMSIVDFSLSTVIVNR